MQSFSFVDMWASMGWPARSVVVVLAIMSVYSLGITVERVATFVRARARSLRFVLELAQTLKKRDRPAALRLAQAGESAAVRLRLRDYTLRTAEHNVAVGMARVPAPWATRVDVFRRYDVDAGNVTRVLNLCLEAGDAEAGLRICTAVSPCWIVWGTFGEGGEWLRAFLALDMTAIPARIQGAATVVRGQLTLSSDPAAAWALGTEGLKLCREADDQYWVAVGLNLLAEIALHTGRIDEAAVSADEALAIAQAADDGWNEGYALGTRAAIAARRGKLREAEQLATASVTVPVD